jgi:hypothetical protein
MLGHAKELFDVDDGWRYPRELIVWSAIQEIAGSITAQLREDFVAFRDWCGVEVPDLPGHLGGALPRPWSSSQHGNS